jgi:cathepsin F
LTISLCATTADEIIFAKFQKFMVKYNKNYSTIAEYTAKFEIFKHNFIHTASKLTLNKSHKVGVTKFFDMTHEEFKRVYRNLKVSKKQLGRKRITIDMSKPTPVAYDWRAQGAVGVIKDQGQCGSCWTFSTVGNIEGLDFIKHHTLQNFAEQQIVDCDINGQDNGCNGGLMEDAMAYLQTAGGLMLTADYPYTATDQSDGDSCNFDITKVHVKLTGHHFAGTTDEAKIAAILFQTGPLAIAINATPFQDYSSGIIDEDAADCDPTQLDHGVTLVGYGANKAKKPYWIIKNSWGADWGENGFVRVARGKGVCGVNTHVVTAVVA